MGFRVYAWQVPITVDIKDEKRAALAYNALYAMANRDARLQGNGTIVPLISSGLTVVDDLGRSFTPELDHEWNGTYEQRVDWQDKQVERAMEDARKMGKEINRETALLQAFETSYNTVLNNGPINLRFGVGTFDYDKAEETFNFLKTGIDPSMSILIENIDENKMDRLIKLGGIVREEDYTRYLPISTDKLLLVDNRDNLKLIEPTDPEWAKGEMGNNEEFEDFADAVAEIPADGPAMEQ